MRQVRFIWRFLSLIVLFISPSVLVEGGEIYRLVTPEGIVIYTNWPPLYPSGQDRATPNFPFPADQGVRKKGTYGRIPEDYSELIHKTSDHYGVDPNLVQSIIKVESNFDPEAISHKGAMGIMQLMPETARLHKVTNPFNPIQNVQGGVRHLRYLLDMYKHDLDLVLAAYNAGASIVNKFSGIPPYRETHNFITRVKSLYYSKTKIDKTELFVVKVDGGYMITDSPFYNIHYSSVPPASTKNSINGRGSPLDFSIKSAPGINPHR